jgi:hypothetical protein
MAQVIPEFSFSAEGGRDFGKLAEQRVYEALEKNLDNNVLVLHSQDYQTRNQYFECVDGEIDFLIIDPDAGIIVLEVKSGTVERRSDGAWYQNGHRMSLSPFEQARKNFYFLKDRLKERFPRAASDFPVGYAVCFPDISSKPDVLLNEVDSGLIITGRELPHIHLILQNAYASYGSASLGEASVKKLLLIKDSLSGSILFERSLPLLLEQEEQVRFRLTDNQAKILEILSNRPRALIKGNPGTGKSILAMRKAKTLAAEGKLVLLLCYNKLLAEQFTKEACDSGYEDNLVIKNYHTLAWNHVEEALGKELQYTNDDLFWHEVLPKMLSEALQKSPLQFDAVIVDEAQDFRASYWHSTRQIMTDDSDCYIFYDPNQNIWKTKLEFPFKDDPYLLRGNCRNTLNICKAVEKWTGIELECLDDAPIGHEVEEIQCTNPTAIHEALECVLEELIDQRGLKPTDLVVLGAHSLQNTSLRKKGPIQIGNFELREGKEATEQQIPYYTYMQFKGCEKPVAILLDVNKNDERWREPMALLTAMTRAKSMLYVLLYPI